MLAWGTPESDEWAAVIVEYLPAGTLVAAIEPYWTLLAEPGAAVIVFGTEDGDSGEWVAPAVSVADACAQLERFAPVIASFDVSAGFELAEFSSRGFSFRA